MTWTSEKPTQPGWYWWRRKSARPQIVLVKRVWIANAPLKVFTMQGTTGTLLREKDGEWSREPVQAPEEASP